jgi:RNA polymerase primary sigma factor
MSVDKVGEIELWSQKKSSFEAPVGEDGDSQLGDFIKSEDYADTTVTVDQMLNRERLNQLLSSVAEREKMVLNLRFGITNGKPHTLAEVAKTLGVSRERVRQIEQEAIKKLRKYAEEEQKRQI